MPRNTIAFKQKICHADLYTALRELGGYIRMLYAHFHVVYVMCIYQEVSIHHKPVVTLSPNNGGGLL